MSEEQNKFTSSSDSFRRKIVEEMEQRPDEIATPAESNTGVRSHKSVASAIDYVRLLETLRIRPTDVIEKPPACLYVVQDGKEYVLGSLGDISTITGKAKSKKTFAVSIAVAAAVSGATILSRIRGALPDTQNAVLLFDTEQSRYYVWNLVKRICRLSNIEDPLNLFIYPLKILSPPERLKAIDAMIRSTPNVGLVVIDGSRDLAVDPILDNKEANTIITYFQQWTAEFGLHLLTVLHQNKADRNLRGVLGTELVNKSETVIEVSRDETNRDVSRVEPKDCRNIDFPPFSFSVDDTGLPYLIEDDLRSAAGKHEKKESPKMPRTVKPGELTDEQHGAILRRASTNVEPGKYQETCHRIKAAAEYFGHKFGESRAKEFMTFYHDKGLLQKLGQTYVLTLQQNEPVSTDLVIEQTGLF